MCLGQLCRKKFQKSVFSLHKRNSKKIYEVKISSHVILTLITFIATKNRLLPYLGLGYVSLTVCLKFGVEIRAFFRKVDFFEGRYLRYKNFPSITAGTGGSGGCVSTRPVSLVNFYRPVLEPRPKKRRKSPIFPRFTVVPLYRASDANHHVSMRSPH